MTPDPLSLFLDAATWEQASPEERAELAAIERARWEHQDQRLRGQAAPSLARELERLDAVADRATIAALDALAKATRTDVPVFRVEESTDDWDTPPQCPTPVARTKTVIEGTEAVTDVVQLDCERRACPVCGTRWAETKAMNMHANFADAAQVRIIDIDADDWERVRKNIARADSDSVYARIPAEHGRLLVITDASVTDGYPTTAASAVLTAEKALHQVAERCAEGKEPAVTTSRNFVSHAAVRAQGQADPEAVYGTLTKLDRRRPLVEALANIAPDGISVASVVADRDADPTQATTCRLRGGFLPMQVALKRGGWISDAESQSRRSEAQAMRRFEDKQRSAERRHAQENDRRRRAMIAASAERYAS